jgi:nitrite reductase/ring-hydroxylating ferredoxin subunit
VTSTDHHAATPDPLVSSTSSVSLSALRERGHARIATESCAALVTWVDGAAYAVSDACPHRGTSLSGGLLRDAVVTCPAHLWQYDVRTGARHDTTGEGLESYPVTVNATDDTVEVTLPPSVPALSLREILQAHARDSRA